MAGYPDHVMGFSTHEMTDWTNSMLIVMQKEQELGKDTSILTIITSVVLLFIATTSR